MPKKNEIIQLFGKPRPIKSAVVEYLVVNGLKINIYDQLKLSYAKAQENKEKSDADDQNRSSQSKEIFRTNNQNFPNFGKSYKTNIKSIFD